SRAAPGPGVTMDVAALARLLHEAAETSRRLRGGRPTARLVGLVRGVHGTLASAAAPRRRPCRRWSLHGGDQARGSLACVTPACIADGRRKRGEVAWLMTDRSSSPEQPVSSAPSGEPPPACSSIAGFRFAPWSAATTTARRPC